jgi:hypothetical protein
MSQCVVDIGTVSINRFPWKRYTVNLHSLIGTVQRKLKWVKSGINRKLMIWTWAAWGLFYILRGLGPSNLNKYFWRFSDF